MVAGKKRGASMAALPFCPSAQALVFWAAIGFVGLSLVFHEPWLDESEAPARLHRFGWNLWGLMESFRGDGHFPLYHVLLFPIFRWGRSLQIDSFTLVKFFTFIQYCVLAFLTCRWIRFPFSALFLFSYYAVFEYGTLSRCYLLAMIFLLIILRSLTTTQGWSRSLTLTAYFLFPLTHVLSCIFILPFFPYLFLRRLWGAMGAVTAGLAIAWYYLSIRQPQDPFSQFYFISDQQATVADYIHRFFGAALSAWSPFSSRPVGWWNASDMADNLVQFPGAGTLPVLLFVGLVLLFLFYLLSTHRPLTLVCFAGGLGCITIMVVKYDFIWFRHVGYFCWPLLLLFVVLLSTEPSMRALQSPTGVMVAKPAVWWQAIATYAAITLLALHTVTGIQAGVRGWVQPFSPTIAQVQVLDQLAQNPQPFTLIAQPCWSFAPGAVAANWRYRSVPLWDLQAGVCNSSVPMEQLLEHVRTMEYPDRLVISVWGVPEKLALENVTNLMPNPELNQALNRNLADFLQERSFRCRVVGNFDDTASFQSRLYECRRPVAVGWQGR